MHKIKLIVRHVVDGQTMGGYVRELDLPFVPTVGMRFEQGNMWEAGKQFLSPAVESVIYDLDEETIACLFNVKDELTSTFWVKLNCEEYGFDFVELGYFR